MMGSVRTYAIHAIDDGALCPAPGESAGRRGFDYADLVRRARIGARDEKERAHAEAHRSVGGGQQAPASPSIPPCWGASIEPAVANRYGPPGPRPWEQGGSPTNTGAADAPALQTPTSADPLTQRLQQLDAPYLDAIASEQHTLLLADYLASRVADFCTDPAVLAQGHWTMRLTLDPTILPDCALSLTLSYFDLTLRFETNHASSRQLVLHHADMLKRRLESLIAQHDAPRTVDIVVQ